MFNVEHSPIWGRSDKNVDPAQKCIWTILYHMIPRYGAKYRGQRWTLTLSETGPSEMLKMIQKLFNLGFLFFASIDYIKFDNPKMISGKFWSQKWKVFDQ